MGTHLSDQDQHKLPTTPEDKLPLELAAEEAERRLQAAEVTSAPAPEPVSDWTYDAPAPESTEADWAYEEAEEYIAPNDELDFPDEPEPAPSEQNYAAPAEYLRSTPPQRRRATVLPQPESPEDPINSSTNEEIAGIARADRASAKAFSHMPRATRSGRAARSAGLDMTDEYRSRTKFRQSLNLTRQQHPYIMDRPLNITNEEAQELLHKIRAVPLYKIQELAMDLNSEEIKRLFHAILLINDNSTFRAIQQLAVQRASWSLYTVGWSTLQRNFPQRWVQQTLELVYNTLGSDPSRAMVRPTYMRRAIGDLVSLGKSDNGFVSDVVRNLNQAYNVSPDEGLESFLEDYQILIDTPFGGSVLGDFFKKADLPVLFRKKEILTQSLPYMHPALAAEVISRVVASRDPIEGEKKYIYRQVADSFLHRTAQHPMWPYMSADLQRAYNRWYINDRLDNHTMMYPGKREFLLTYLEDIEDVAMLTNDLMAIRFDRFILIDDRRRGDSCLYYDNESVRELLLKGLDEKDLGNPSIPARTTRDAISGDRLQGVMRLSFTAGNLQYSREFMDRLLGHQNQRRRENILRNWFRQD